MNTLVNALRETCEKQKFTEKKLIVNNYQSGYQLLEGMARAGGAWLNVSVVTPSGLAEEIARQALANANIRVIDDGEILLLIGTTLKEMRARGELIYFAELEGLYGPEGILKNALMELRLAGVKVADINIAVFVDKQKGEEIKKLLAGYEQKLENGKLADQASVYLMALEVLQNNHLGDNIQYLIPGQLEFNYLAFSFLDKLFGGNALVLPAEPVCGLTRPAAFFFKAESRQEVESPLAQLYKQQDWGLSDDPDLDFFQAYSPACEVKEVFRRLRKDEISVDQTLVCYTNGETYLPLVHSVAETYGVPVTYADGLPVIFTRPGKLLAGLLDWFEDNYSAVHIYRLLCTGGIKASWSHLLAELLRRAAVGWGRERYQACLSSLKENIKEELKQLEDKGYNTHYRSVKLDKFPKLEKLVLFMLEKVPEENENGTVQFDRLCRGLAEIIEKYASTVSDNDRLARESLMEMLDQLAKSWPDEVDKRAAVKRIKARLNWLRVGASAPVEGHLHVSSLDRAEFSNRPFSFVLGLAGQYFPGSGLQDAVLLDREREGISKNLSLAAFKPERNLYQLNRLLASRRGRIALSFSCFEPVEGRPAFPASVLLQAHRLKSGKPEADYSDFFNSLDPPAAYYPANEGEVLAINEWWLSLVLGRCKNGEMSSVKVCYSGIKAGLEAEEVRRSDQFTEYDGRVNVDARLVDPRLNNAKTLSASAIEKLAGCPYAYFLQNMLYVKPPEEKTFDRWAWLDVMARGTLLHAIYARYLRAVCSGPGSPREDRDELFKIAEAEIAKKKSDSPPPSEVVFQSEKNALLRELETFLKCERQLWQEGSIPAYMEAPFGRGPEAVQEAGIGSEDPIEYQLPGQSKILIRGNIDRIDHLPKPDHFRVWDFKTGGTYGYKSSDYIKKGRQIQHALYASAAETILRDKHPTAVVEEAGYLFPTEKGEGERHLREQHQRDKAKEAVELMLELLSTGAFCLAEKGDDSPCKFCDYPAVCRYPQALEDLGLKKTNPANTILDPWRELQEYE